MSGIGREWVGNGFSGCTLTVGQFSERCSPAKPGCRPSGEAAPTCSFTNRHSTPGNRQGEPHRSRTPHRGRRELPAMQVGFTNHTSQCVAPPPETRRRVSVTAREQPPHWRLSVSRPTTVLRVTSTPPMGTKADTASCTRLIACKYSQRIGESPMHRNELLVADDSA